MTQPIVIAHHLIWTAYGWWLPNDPRGSGSTTIRKDIIAELGELHHGRKTVQPGRQEIREFQATAATLLQDPRLTFDSAAVSEIALAFTEVIERERYTCYACAIMPDHVHILIRKHKHHAEEMMEILKEASRIRLRKSISHFSEHRVWASGGGWKVFLDEPNEVRRTVTYILRNPLPLGLPEQRWLFVKEYDGWPLHPAHNPNSPYAQRLRAIGRYPQ
jgi:REP element-mobilizing transposase RayT